MDPHNSGDVPGDPRQGMRSDPAATSPSAGCRAEAKQWLLDLAKRAVRIAVTGQPQPTMTPPDGFPRLHAPCGCFVTLTRAGQLCGCIGHLTAQLPLWQAVRDSRFASVQPEELAELRFEISLLTEPRSLAFTAPEELLACPQSARVGSFYAIW